MPSKIDYSFSLKNRQNSLTASRHGNEGPSGKFCEHSPFSNIDEGSGQNNRIYTVDEAVEHFGFGTFHARIAVITGLVFMSDALEMMCLVTLTTALGCDWVISRQEMTILATCVFSGWALGGFVWGQFADKYGRRQGLILSTFVAFYFGILSSLAPNLYWLMVLRGLVGFGVGGSSVAFTLFAEYSQTKLRAKMSLWLLFFWPLGSCFEVGLSIIILPKIGWRWLLAISSLPSLIATIACFKLTESVRYEVASGNTEEAVRTLKKIALANNIRMPKGTLIQRSLTRTNVGSYKALFGRKHILQTLTMWMIWFSQNFLYYGLLILAKELMFYGDVCKINETYDKSVDSCTIKCLEIPEYYGYFYASLAEFIAILISLLLLDSIGRKKTLIISFGIFAIFSFTLNVCNMRKLIAASFIICRCSIQVAIQTSFVYVAEYYPTHIRALGVGASNGMARAGAITTYFLAKMLIDIDGHLAVSVYGCVALVTTFLPLILKETKGRVLK